MAHTFELTFCKVRHGDSVTKPNYYYYYSIIIIWFGETLQNVVQIQDFVSCLEFGVLFHTKQSSVGQSGLVWYDRAY